MPTLEPVPDSLPGAAGVVAFASVEATEAALAVVEELNRERRVKQGPVRSGRMSAILSAINSCGRVGEFAP